MCRVPAARSMSVISWGDEQLIKSPGAIGLRRSMPPASALRRPATARAAHSPASHQGGHEPEGATSTGVVSTSSGAPRKQVMIQVVAQGEGPNGTAAIFASPSSSGAEPRGLYHYGAEAGVLDSTHPATNSSHRRPAVAAGLAPPDRGPRVWGEDGGADVWERATPAAKRRKGGRAGRTGRRLRGRKTVRQSNGAGQAGQPGARGEDAGLAEQGGETGAGGEGVSAAVAEVADLLRELEVAVSAAEYAAALRGGHQPQQAVPPVSQMQGWQGVVRGEGRGLSFAGGSSRVMNGLQAPWDGGTGCVAAAGPMMCAAASSGHVTQLPLQQQARMQGQVQAPLQQQVQLAGVPLQQWAPPAAGEPQHVALPFGPAAGTITGAWMHGGNAGHARPTQGETLLVPARVEAVSEQLARWCNLCDEALARGL